MLCIVMYTWVLEAEDRTEDGVNKCFALSCTPGSLKLRIGRS